MKRKVLAAILAVTMVASVFVGMTAGASDSSKAPSSEVVNSDVNLFKAAGGDVSFEDGTYVPENWTQGEVSTEVAHTGDKSFKKKDSWGTGGHIIIPNVNIEQGKNYVVSFWYYWDGSTAGNATGFLREDNNGGSPINNITGTVAPRTGEDGNDPACIWYSNDEDGIWSGKNVGQWIYVERYIEATKDVGTVCLSFTGQNVYYIDDICLIDAANLPTPEPVVEPTKAPDEPGTNATKAPETNATKAPETGATTAPTVTPGTSTTASPTATATVGTGGNGGSETVKKSIKFKKKKVTIKKGKKATLKVTIKGAKKAKFSVNKKGKKVVKLSKKKAKSVVVKGKKKGKATITAKAAGKKATCKVTVK